MYEEKSDEDGCGWELEKEKKNETEVDGQCKCGHEGKGLSFDFVEASCHIYIDPHRSGKRCGVRRRKLINLKLVKMCSINNCLQPL